MNQQRLVVGISGSSGAILGVRLLQALRPLPVQTHLVITRSARLTIQQETDFTLDQVMALADTVHAPDNLAAPVASGSFDTLGMVIIPCSIKTLSAVANSYTTDLMARAADVTLKEGRPLILVVREAPLHRGHIRLLDLAAQAGAVIFPPVPAFYTRPASVDTIVENIVGRVLRRLGIANTHYQIWAGMGAGAEPSGAPDPQPVQPPAPEASGPFPAETALWSLPAMSLSTTAPDGTPHAAAVYFAAAPDRTALYFFSSAESQHSRDIAADPRAAASIHPLVEGWQEITGLQLRGTVRAVAPGPEWDAAWTLYAAKFPFSESLKDVVARNALYVFSPQWVRLTDNRRGFGYKAEWQANENADA